MAKTKQVSQNDRQIVGIAIDTKKVKITFINVNGVEPNQEEGEEESSVEANEYSIKTTRKPHKELLDAMKKLRKDAVAICEMNFDAKALGTMTVSAFKISGDLLLKQSRIVMTLSKEVKRTGKLIKWSTPQVTMYGKTDYEKDEEMSKLVEEAIAQIELFMEGQGDKQAQLPLFPKVELQMV